jgi:hypothetical protein
MAATCLYMRDMEDCCAFAAYPTGLELALRIDQTPLTHSRDG